MCGITGFWGEASSPRDLVMRMTEQIRARGPDDVGTWFDPTNHLAIGHRRLSILDLSTAGHQPMISPCGRYVLIYNGEIYNHIDIRVELECKQFGYQWRGHSDTEILLAALSYWGIESTLARLNGMFAFALWDLNEKTLTLARDRLGEKPLYYAFTGNTFIFGSELKALRVHPEFPSTIDRNSLALFLRYGYVPTPYTIYEGVFKLPPAHYLVINNSRNSLNQPVCYWGLNDLINARSPIEWNDDESVVDELEGRLKTVVGRRMISDVPLGGFLSGGLDSSLIVAMMQSQSAMPVKTFTVGFNESTHNEANFAHQVATHLGTDHTELYVTPKQAMDIIPSLPTIYDEPFADSSQIPTVLISKLARASVKVALSGDGGDELFCGYTRYLVGYSLWLRINKLPSAIRKGIIYLMRNTPTKLVRAGEAVLPYKIGKMNIADKLPKLANVLSHQEPLAFYKELVSQINAPSSLLIDGKEPTTFLDFNEQISEFCDFREVMMYLDTKTYLPDDILTKVDRASMSLGLEARVPFLDHTLVEFVWQMPMKFKFREGQGKWMTKQLLRRYIPDALIDRPKMGFGVPIEDWLKGPLRGWVEDLLNDGDLKQQGFFYPEKIRQMWQEHLSGNRGWHYQLWCVLMFQAWLENEGRNL